MKRLKSITFWLSLFPLSLLLLTLTFTSCSDDDDDKNNNSNVYSELIGTWSRIQGRVNDLIFREDGSFEWDELTGKFTYNENEETLTLYWDDFEEKKEDDIETYRINIDNGILTMTELFNGHAVQEYRFYKENEEVTYPFIGIWDGGSLGTVIFEEDGTFNLDGRGEYTYDESKNILTLIWNQDGEVTEQSYSVYSDGYDEVILTGIDNGNVYTLEQK